MNEQILTAFKNHGFLMWQVDELGYGFQYEGIKYLLLADNDEEFLSVVIPAVLEKGDVGELEYYVIMDRFNSTVKYVKAYEMFGSVWLGYEREMLEGDNPDLIIPHIILNLENSTRTLQGIINDVKNGNGSSELSQDDGTVEPDNIEINDTTNKED